MNKIQSILLACSLIAVVFLSGCISQDTGDDNGSDIIDDFIPDDGPDMPSDVGQDEGDGSGGASDDDGSGDDVPPVDDGGDDDDGGPDEPVPPIDDGEDDEDNGSQDDTPPQEEGIVNGSLQQRSGWIDSPDSGSSDKELIHVEEYNFTEESLTEITFYIRLEDSDEEHAETDEGSDPDMVGINITSDAGDWVENVTWTPSEQEYTFKAGNGYLSNLWSITIWGEEFGSGTPAYMYRPGTVYNESVLVYIDQGAAWTINVNYRYFV
jgi:hypothetical protein